jgi:hypothetical protein
MAQPDDELMEIARRQVAQRQDVIEAYIRVYLASTGFKIEDCELVEMRDETGSMHYWIQPKEKEKEGQG